MPKLAYSPLSREELDVLLAPGGEEMAQAWERLTGGFRTLMHLKSITYPRPLIPEADAREWIAGSLEALKGSPLYRKAVRNAHTVEEIERLLREGEAGPGLYRAVDDFIEAMLEESYAIRYHLDLPPVLTPEREPDSESRRGRRTLTVTATNGEAPPGSRRGLAASFRYSRTQ